MFRAIVFTVVDCGFRPRTALELDDSAEIRLQKIEKLIEQSKFGVHDLSNMRLDPKSNLPRFNMPLELGLFLGAKRFGEPKHKKKRAIILDQEQYRYQQSISDISGQDIKSHNNDPNSAIRCIRDFLKNASGRKSIPGARHIIDRYAKYESDLPRIVAVLRYDIDDLTFNDLWETMVEWQKENFE